MKRIAVLVVLLCFVVPPSGAAAARSPLFEQAPPPDLSSEWFALAGDGVAHLRFDQSRAAELRFTRASGQTTVVRRFEPPPNSSVLVRGVRGSSSDVATGISMGSCGRTCNIDSDDVFAGPAAGPLRQFVDFCSFPGLIALDANRVAYMDRCDVPDRRFVVRDVASGQLLASAALPEFGNVRDVELAGRYLGWEVNTAGGWAITVRDLETGRDVQQVAGYGTGFALQADGKVARVVDPSVAAGGCGFVEWFALEAPGTAHRVPGCVAGIDVAFAQDRIAYVALDGRRRVASLASTSGAVQRIASPADSVDWDGRRLVYGSPQCDGTAAVYVVERDAGDEAEDPACPVRVGRTRELKFPHPSVRIACPGGCRGGVRVQRSGGRGLSGAQFAIPSGGKRRIRLQIHPYTASVLSRRHRTRVVMKITTVDRDGRRSTVRRVMQLVGRP